MRRIVCRPVRVGRKPGPKPVYVKPHRRSPRSQRSIDTVTADALRRVGEALG